MSFSIRTKIRFAHVDAAGIVFYPRYFEMLNAALEDWFSSMLGVDFATLHLSRRVGVPTVRIACEFYVPSLLGEEVEITITPVEVGKSSCSIRYSLSCDGTERLKADAVIVYMDLDAKRAMPWPDDIRARIKGELCSPEGVR